MATSKTICLLLMASILMDTSGTFTFRDKKFPGLSSRGYSEGGRKLRRDSHHFTPKPMKVADNITFMEDYPDYPEKILMGILKKEGKDRKDFFGKDYQEPILKPRLGFADTVLCPSREKIAFPKVGLNKDNDWKYIVNVGEEYIQGVLVETCERNDKCAFSESFPSGYTTKCEQKFVFRRLLSVAEKGSTVVDEFRMPSCCSCAIKGPST